MRMEEFDRQAWMSFQGCAGWSTADGRECEPLIGEGRFADGTRYCLVLDRTGGCLLVEDDPVNDYGGRVYPAGFPTQAAARAFASGIGEPQSLDAFLSLGFREA